MIDWSAVGPNPPYAPPGSTDLPDGQYASKADGDRQAIGEADQFDMTGWAVEQPTSDRTYTFPFAKTDLPKGPDGRFSYFGGDWMPVWAADTDRRADEMTLIDPQGERHEHVGYVHS